MGENRTKQDQSGPPSDPDGAQPFADLTPDLILDAVDAAGYVSNGRCLALNSYENRVYRIGLEDGSDALSSLVVKFYRPARWTDEAIDEEHQFALELAGNEIPVVAPLQIDGETLLRFGGYRYAVYPNRGGRWPDLERHDNREWLGRFLGRIHMLGRERGFVHRETLNVFERGWDAANYVLENDWLPDSLIPAYESVSRDLLEMIEQAMAGAGGGRVLRLHGDCHPGNILWTDDGPHFVDLDDCMMGPAIQDLWMLLSGDREEMATQLGDLLEGYRRFSDFDRHELSLIEPLRSLRMIHYSAWLARRWHDPAFPRAFPWFAETRYWEEQILALREQMALIDESPIEIDRY